MSDQIQLYIDEQGEKNRPAILFSHGLSGSARNWRPQIAALKSNYHLVSYDLRGHARSSAPLEESAYGESALVNDLLYLSDITEARQPVLCGLSLGAAVSLEAALKHPEKFKGLVLVSYPASKMVPQSIRQVAKEFADSIRNDGLDSAGKRYVWGENSQLTPADARLVRMGFLEHKAHGIANLLSTFLASLPELEERCSELQQLKLPTLIIAGDKDAPCVKSAQLLAKYIPNAALAIIPKAGHLVNIEGKALFNETLQKFLEKIAH